MAEEEDKQEEKFEFTREGEARGYISLDQARVLALRHAHDNREFYGRYAESELVWQELSAQESEDYYRVRLSYRPARGFRRAGVEQFTIDKGGPIEFRQILHEPRPLWTSPILVTVAVLVVAVIVVGTLFGVGVLPPSSTEQTTQVVSVGLIPQTPTRLESSDGAVVVDVPAKSVREPAQLTYVSLSATESPVLPKSFQTASRAFDLTADATILNPITITIALSAADATLAAGDE